MITIDIRDQMSHNILEVRLRTVKREEYKDYFDLTISLENHSGVVGEEICIRHLNEDSLKLLANTIQRIIKC